METTMNRGINLKVLLLLMIVAIAVLLGFSTLQNIVVGNTTISHAIPKHGEEAIATFNCLDQNGADIVYRKGIDEKRAVQLCLLPNKKGLGIRVIELINGKWEEITSYVKQDIVEINGAMDYAEMDMGKYGTISWIKECWRGLFFQ